MLCIIMLRSITTPSFDHLWIESYNSIRKFYPDVDIKIIDNGSTCASTIPLQRCEIIKSEYATSRLFSPYYEFLKIDGYTKAVIVHDGFIFNSYVDFTSVNSVRFMWHFETHDYDNSRLIEKQLTILDNSKKVVDMFVSKSWYGCMGCMCVITKEFLHRLEDKYKFTRLADVIDNKEDAIAFERTLAVLCYSEIADLKDTVSFEGDIVNMQWGYRYEDYVRYPSNRPSKPFFKLFGAR